MINNEVIACIRGRRSTRKFDSVQISPEQLDTLLDAAIWAPSGGNNQTWLFTAVQNEEMLLHLNGLVCKAFQTWVPDDDYPGKHAMKERSSKEGFNFFHSAPTLIIASNRPNYANAMADCALALQNVFLAAQSMGLGSCYINQLHWLRYDTSVREYLLEFGIPKEHVICSAAAVGHIAAESSVPPRKEGTVHIIR